MDTQKDLIDKLVRIGLSALGAAATTAVLLSMFQDPNASSGFSGPLPSNSGSASSRTTASSKGNENKKDSSDGKDGVLPGIPKVGDGTALIPPNFVQGLIMLSERASKEPHQIGYFDNWGTPAVILTNPEHVRVTLQHNVQHALWAGLLPASASFFGKKVLFILEGDEWKQLRNLMRESFKRQALPLLAEDITASAYQLLNKLEIYADRQQSVDMNYALSVYHLTAVAQSSMGYSLGCMDHFYEGPEEVLSAFEFMLNELPRRAFSPDPKLNADYTSDNEDNRKWNHHAKTVRDVVTKIVSARLAERSQGKAARNDLLDAMIGMYESEAGDASSKDPAVITSHIGDNLIELLFAGIGTSVGGAAVALYFLATNPEWYERVQKEVDSAITESGSNVGVGYHPSQFPLLTRVFKESLRLVPPAPLISRQITKELNLDGVIVPTDALVWFPAIYLHNDKSVWGPDADKFNPDRFIKDPVPGSYIPFALGPRECIGQHFAIMESVVVMAVLLKEYTFHLAEGYNFAPTFTGFGLRPFDATTGKVAVNLVPKRRTNTSEFMFDWTPKKSRRGSQDRSSDEGGAR